MKHQGIVQGLLFHIVQIQSINIISLYNLYLKVMMLVLETLYNFITEFHIANCLHTLVLYFQINAKMHHTM